jgi:hypothetical protein
METSPSGLSTPIEASQQRASRVRTVPILAVFLALACASAIAGKTFVMPEAHPAKSYPAHDEHTDEKTTAAVDPYDMDDKAQIFSVRYRDYGFLPVFFVVTNDGDQPVTLSGMKIQLITVDRTKLAPASTDDLLRRMSHPSRNDRPVPLPIPLPTKVKGAVSRQALDEINAAQFGAKAVEPHTTARGFLFFDISGISTPLAGANVYLSGLHDAKGGELMYFEIALEKYLSAPAEKKP